MTGVQTCALPISALHLCCCAWAFSSCGEWGLLFIVVRRLLIAVASLVVEIVMFMSRRGVREEGNDLRTKSSSAILGLFHVILIKKRGSYNPVRIYPHQAQRREWALLPVVKARTHL